MSKTIHINFLENCPFSINAKNLLEENNIPFSLTQIERSNMDQYKTREMPTFPQIFYVKNDTERKIGGNAELQSIIEFYNKNKTTQNLRKMITDSIEDESVDNEVSDSSSDCSLDSTGQNDTSSNTIMNKIDKLSQDLNIDKNTIANVLLLINTDD